MVQIIAELETPATVRKWIALHGTQLPSKPGNPASPSIQSKAAEWENAQADRASRCNQRLHKPRASGEE